MAAIFASMLAHELSVIAVICLLALFQSSSLSLNSPSFSTTHHLSSLAVSSSHAPVQEVYRCYPPDCAALQEVAASFSRSSSAAHTFFHLHWKPELDCCFWLGVTCSPIINSTSTTSSNNTANPKVILYSRVLSLSLADTTYSSVTSISIPVALCHLSELASLHISDYWLVGSIPSCIGHNLTSLYTLILSGNGDLSGSLSPLANLSLLSHLDLSSNNFTSISSSITCHLQYLDLSYNSLSGSLSPLANLSLLSHLDLSSNNFNTSISSFITCILPHLQYLDLSYNFGLSGSISFINGLPNLQHLDLIGNQLSGIFSPASNFSTTPLLQYLGISFNDHQLTAGDIRSLEQLLHLEDLWMEMIVSASSLGSLFCKLRSLKSLELSADASFWQESDIQNDTNQDLHDKLLCEKPASAMSLTLLDLSGQGYTGLFPVWFGDFTRLQTLSLSGNKFEGSIPQEWQALTQLTVLVLSGDSPLIPVFFSQQVQSWLFRLPLEILSLRSMGLTSLNFPCVGLSLLNHTLYELDLSDNQISPGHSLWHCLHHHNFSQLYFLNLSYNPLALPLQPLLPQLLYTLDLSFCNISGQLNMETLPLAEIMLLHHNNLTGSIPSQIGTLGSSISVLDLSYNKFTGLIPSSLSNITGVALILANNQLHGELALISCKWEYVLLANNLLTKASFRNVSPDLGVLDLSFNKLQGNIEDLLGDYSVLSNLEALLLGNNQLTGPIPTSLGTSASSLIIMDISNNNLTGAIPHSLQLLHALHLHIGLGRIGFMFFDIGRRGELNTFDYQGAFITLESVKNVKLLLNVELLMYKTRGYLDLSSNELSGSIPEGLGALIGLQDLNLSRNLLSGPIPPSLANLSDLESLDLSYNTLHGSIPMAFSQLSSLAVFNVSFNPDLSGEIPGGPQLENAASYEGDYKLCGEPVHEDCGEQQILTPSSLEPSYTQQHEKLGIRKRISLVKEWIEEWATIPGICLGYILGMGLTIWALKMLHFYK